MPRALPDEILEEVLRRLPPQEPAELVRAALVCRRWCRLVSDPGFRRRFREFHRRPPILGMLCNDLGDNTLACRFVPTTAFCSPHTRRRRWHALDARHGRVLLHRKGGVLLVWDPMTDEVRRELPFPHKALRLGSGPWTAAVLCSAAASAGGCGHFDCRHGPFLVVFVSSQHGKTVFYTYSSDAAAWSEPVCAQQNYLAEFWTGSVLVGNSLYFRSKVRGTALKYDLKLRQVSLILLPSSVRWRTLRLALLTTSEDGGLGLVYKDDYDSKLYMWSRKDTLEVDAQWERRVIIILKEVLPVDVDVAKLRVIGSGVGIIFMRTGDEVYTIDLKTHEVKKVYEGTTDNIIPYMSFCTPALKAAPPAEQPGADGASA